MSRLFAIADITGANLLSDSEVVSCVRAIAFEHGVAASDIIVVATPTREHLRESLSDYRWSPVPTPLVAAGLIRQLIGTYSRQEVNPYVIVFTYVADVRKLEKTAWKGVTVTTKSLGSLRPGLSADGEISDSSSARSSQVVRSTAELESHHPAMGESAVQALRIVEHDASAKKVPRGLEIRDGYKRAGLPDLFSHARRAIEEALCEVVTNLSEPQHLQSLVGKAMAAGPAIIESWPTEQQPRRSKNLPWRSAFHLVVKLILETGGAIGEDGEPLRPHDAFRRVARFDRDWREKLYGHLLKVLALAIGPVSEPDIRPIAGYWFFDDGPNNLLAVNTHLERLVDAGELECDKPNGVRTWSLPGKAARLVAL
jgi:hypothetical protein